MSDEYSENFDVPIVEFSVKETEKPAPINEESKAGPIIMKRIEMLGSDKVEEILNELKEGNIIIADISPLIDEGPQKLKNSVNRLKKSTMQMGGELARISDSYILLTPKFVEIEHSRED